MKYKMESDEYDVETKPAISRRMVENFISDLEELIYDSLYPLFKQNKKRLNKPPGVHNRVKAGLMRLYHNQPSMREACNEMMRDAQQGTFRVFQDLYCPYRLFKDFMRYMLATDYAIEDPTDYAIEDPQDEEDKKDESVEDVITQRSENDRVGLKNLANTCWVNSVLQALFMTYKFCTAVLGSDAHSQPLLFELQCLFALLLHSPRSVISPLKFLKVAIPDGFEPGDQQDSSEFLTYLLEGLQVQERHAASAVNMEARDATAETESMDTGCNLEVEVEVKVKVVQRLGQARGGFSHSSSMQAVVLGIGENAPPANTDSSIPYISLVQHTFGGRWETGIKCLGCQTESVKADAFLDIQLAFPPERNSDEPIHVQELLNYFTKPEELIGENQYQCDTCKGLRDAKQFIRILQFPSHLILTLKCFEYDSITDIRNKLIRDVKFKENIQFYSEPYALYAAVIHSGSTPYNGHYYTMAKDKTHAWMFNDSNVGPYDESSWGRNDMPYILFYSRYEEEYHPSVKAEHMLQLQPHLTQLIMNDSEEFRQEMEQKEKKNRKRQQDLPPENGGKEIKLIDSPGGSGDKSLNVLE